MPNSNPATPLRDEPLPTGLMLRTFDPLTATTDEWAAFHAFRRVIHVEGEPERPPPPDADDEFKRRQGAEDEEWLDGAVHVVDSAGAVVARASWGAEAESSVDFKSNGHLIWGWIGVLPEHRRCGIGRRLARHLYNTASSLDRRVITQWVELPSGQAFAERYGGQAKQMMPDYELALAAVDWEKMDRWIGGLERRAPGYADELLQDRLPNSLWPEYCSSKTTLMNLSPRDDLDMGDWTYTVEVLSDDYAAREQAGTKHHNVLVREPGGAIVAITDTVWSPADPLIVRQHFTGVHPDHRGQGLGKYIKARMLRHLVERHGADGIERIRTGTADSNASMRAINDRMGFVEYSRAIVYQIEREALGATLG